MRCPNCKNKVIQRSGREIRIRTKGKHVITEDSRYLAQCYWCGTQVELPLQLSPGVQVPSEAFFVSSNTPKT